MEMVVTGLDEAECRRLVGEATWAAAGLAWKDRVDAESAVASGAPVLWLYLPPATRVPAVPEHDWDSIRKALAGWVAANRPVFALRGRLGKRLHMLNAAHPALSEAIRAISLGTPVATAPLQGDATDDNHSASLFLCGLLPDVHDAYLALEAAASLPMIRFSASGAAFAADETYWEAFFRLICNSAGLAGLERQAEALRLQEESARAENMRSDAEADGERSLLRAENRQMLERLHSAQEEIEELLLSSKAAKSRTILVDSARATAEARNLQLELQLNNLRSELELTESARRAGAQQLIEQSARALALEKNISALRIQLGLLQDEMVAIEMASRHPAPDSGSLRRLASTVTRRVPVPARVAAWLGRRRSGRVSERERWQIGSSRWFDAAWYLAQYPDVANAKMDPVAHYLEFGWKEQRDPSPAFSTRYYLANNPDVAASGMSPLQHFLRFGLREGRFPREVDEMLSTQPHLDKKK